MGQHDLGTIAEILVKLDECAVGRLSTAAGSDGRLQIATLVPPDCNPCTGPSTWREYGYELPRVGQPPMEKPGLLGSHLTENQHRIFIARVKLEGFNNPVDRMLRIASVINV